MLRQIARPLVAVTAALVADACAVALVAADASFVPGVTPEGVGHSSPAGIVIPGLVLAAALLALVAIVRATSRRGASGVVLGLLGMLFGVVLVLAGFIGDLSGQHRIGVAPLVAGIILIGGCAYGIVRLRRARARSESGDRSR